MEEEVYTISQKPLSPRKLTSCRSLIINPHTSDYTISSILETITQSFKLTSDPSVSNHTLKLLTDFSSHRPEISPHLFELIRSDMLSTESTRFAAECLMALALISDQNPSLGHLLNEIDDQFFVSLCFEQPVKVRLWLLRNADKFLIRPYLLFTVFLGFTKDPYPYVREAGLDGLVDLCKTGDFESIDAIEGCYCRAVVLLQDMEDCVRCAAVRVVTEWGKMLAAAHQDKEKSDWLDVLFLQLCSMVRDMSIKVRIEAFDALGKIRLVSEDVLLSTLSKKGLENTKEKKFNRKCSAGLFEYSVAQAARIFIHGLEDEFHEVRKSACNSLRSLSVISAKFATDAFNLLMDMLNDDSSIVKLQALETLHHIATCWHLNVQEVHMHSFHGALVDSNPDMRSATRKILKLVKLPNLELFKQLIDGLLQNLEMYPQDEADIFRVMFDIGQSHDNYAVRIIKKMTKEICPNSGSKLAFDGAQVAAFLTLAISAVFSDKQNFSCIPPEIFSYSVSMMGRISRALSNSMDQNTLLAYLRHCTSLFNMGLTGDEPLFEVCKHGIHNHLTTEICHPFKSPLRQKDNEASENPSQSYQISTSLVESQLKENGEVTMSVNCIFAKINGIWSLVLSGCKSEALRALRLCKAEVASYTTDSFESAGAVAFALQYIQVLKLLARAWEHFVPIGKVRSNKTGDLELLMGKLDRKLREIRCRFVRLSGKEELNVLELLLVACVLRLSKVDICGYLTTMKKLSSIILQIEFLCKEGCIKESNFYNEIKRSLHENDTSFASTSCGPLLFKKLVDCFSIEQFVVCGTMRHITAELDICGNNYENPIPFVPGLPVTIPFEITLCNVANESSRLWLKMASDESIQFFFPDLEINESYEELKKLKFFAPYYKTPKAVSFTLTVSVGMECLYEDAPLLKGCGGPKHELIYLCRGKSVFLSRTLKH